MSNTLLPCPFCGGEARIKSRYIGYGSVGLGARDWYTVECNECRAKSDEYGAELEAIAAWNRRAEPEINAAPVVRGEWIKSDNYKGWLVCSACRDCYVDNAWVNSKKWRYCPNCGALMEDKPCG